MDAANDSPVVTAIILDRKRITLHIRLHDGRLGRASGTAIALLGSYAELDLVFLSHATGRARGHNR